jgi:hypothetical protein
MRKPFSRLGIPNRKAVTARSPARSSIIVPLPAAGADPEAADSNSPKSGSDSSFGEEGVWLPTARFQFVIER